MPENSSQKHASPPFIHLRLHTEFSISDGLVRVKSLIQRLRDLSMPAVAVTDKANLFGLIKFYSGSVKQGLKPVCGCDILVADDVNKVVTRLALLVKDQTGYLNLTEMISNLYTENPGHSQRLVSRSELQAHSEGLIALSGGLESDIGKALSENDLEHAETLLKRWLSIFPDNFYLEVQRVGKEGEEKYIDGALALAHRVNCPVVATNDVCFIDADDFEAHEVRVCINDRRTLDDPRRPRNYTAQQYLRSADEMAELFADIPEALANTVEISKRCNLDLKLGTPCLPNYPVPTEVGLEDYLCSLSSDGLERRLRGLYDPLAEEYAGNCQPYRERLELELGTINHMGFAGYFLIVMEFIQWAKDEAIPVGPGRGSGAGSIVAWALGITELDPLRYDLLFERFLNPERVSMPDFDVDFCMEGRDRVIQHVASIYGKEAVSQIITFGTMAAKAVVRDVARVQGKSYGLADKLSKLIPFEPGMTLQKAFEDEPQLGEFVGSDEDAQEIMEMARKLEGITRNVGKHAGGVVIAPTKLTDFTALYCDENGHGLVTQFDKYDVETAGLVKFDFLGLRTLTIIDWTIKMINAQENLTGAQQIDIATLPLDDESVYRLLKKGETTAVFQLESRGMKELIKRLKPSCFEDIIALVALFRPGPLQSGMVDDFIDRKHGREPVVYPHPDLEHVLSNTYGVILYQEQVMQIAQVLASYTLSGADILRKAMGKKDPAVMAKQRDSFMDGAKARGIDEELAGTIFDLMEKFAGYGFNKSHSAAYALVSYQTAWLKTHYPAYFMATVLSADMQNTDKIVTLIDECRSMELEIVPPDVNLGQFNFTVTDQGKIVYGLGAIKGLGEGPVSAIIQTRDDAGHFTSLLDLCQRVSAQSVNKRTMEALIKSGALDRLVGHDVDYARAILTATIADAIQAADQSSRNLEAGLDDLFGEITPVSTSGNGDTGGWADKNIRPWAEQQRLAAEKETLGLYLSGHPIDEFIPELAHITRSRLATLRPERGTQLAAGLLHSMRTAKSKSGETRAILVLDDRSGRFEITLFPREYEKYRDTIQIDRVLVVECTVRVDDYDGTMRGRGKRVMTLSEARRKFVHRLTVNLEANGLKKGFCEHLADILAPYRPLLQSTSPVSLPAADNDANSPGQGGTADAAQQDRCPVVIQYERSGSRGCIMLGKEWAVSPSDDLIQKLRREYGKDKIVLDYNSERVN
ncbi:MAG: DNA polymerase III subunit alpha [Gammaproteobacteria bacterium]|jgi:DNA polymerase-3 subunit alpha|nr:DNA polymerase III subunit alpha [Gammaproteobacteria bacterium]|tara:strand:- start:1526 stop:5149 length:3624 start_codon:yes stop_codon:yes gene_type:complete